MEKGLQILEHVIELTGRMGIGSLELPARFFRASLWARNGQAAAAHAQMTRLVEEAEQRGMLVTYLAARLHLAKMELQNGQEQTALEHLRTVRAKAAEVNAVIIEILACMLEGTAEAGARRDVLLAELDRQTQTAELRPHYESFLHNTAENIF